MIKVGIVGLGYWGPNLLRNFYNHPLASVKSICDIDGEKVAKYLKQYPNVQDGTVYFQEFLKKDLDLVVIATPPETHYELCKLAIESGRSVLVEKPFTTSVKQCEDLINLSERKNLKIFVDHTFAFNPSVRKIKEVINKGELGKIIYFDSERVRGLYSKAVNVIWDLAVHDFSILIYLGYDIKVKEVLSGKLYGGRREDMAHITFTTDDSIIGHIYVNWFSPVKIRKMIIGGSDKILWWDDVHPFEKLRIYESSGDDLKRDDNPFFPTYIAGDIRILKIDNKESLAIEVDSIVRSIMENSEPEAGKFEGLKVVRLLEECDMILQMNTK